MQNFGYEFPVFKGFHEQNGRKTYHKKKHAIPIDFWSDCEVGGGLEAPRAAHRDLRGSLPVIVYCERGHSRGGGRHEAAASRVGPNVTNLVMNPVRVGIWSCLLWNSTCRISGTNFQFSKGSMKRMVAKQVTKKTCNSDRFWSPPRGRRRAGGAAEVVGGVARLQIPLRY